MKKYNKKNNILIFILYLLPLFAIVALALIVNKNYSKLLHPDFSGNIMLGKIIAQENRLFFSKNWYYGTEIRFIHTQIIYSILFRMTSDFKIVTVASTVISLIILVICFYIFLKFVGLTRYFPLLSLLILIPWPIGLPSDYPYHVIILIQQDYIPYLCFAFLILGAFIYYLKNKKHYIVLIISVSFLTLLYSISGTRALVSLIAPLLLTYLLIFIKELIISKKQTFKNKKFEIIFVCAIGFSCLLGLIINKYILAKTFNFNPSPFKISISLDSIRNAFVSLLRSLSIPTSFNPKTLMLLQILIFLGIITTLVFYLIAHKQNKISFEQRIVFNFQLFGVLLTFASYCFLNFYNNDNGFRYYFLLEIFLVCFAYLPLIYLLDFISKFKLKHTLIATCSSFFSFLVLINYHFSFNIYRYTDLTNIVNTILKENYHIAYSAWEDTNQICQLSNSKIDSYTFNSYDSGYLNPSGWICEKKKNYVNIRNITVVINKTHIETNLYKKCELLSVQNNEIDGYKIFFISDARVFFNNTN